jgi:gamma-glutamyl-gamma-aminobutyrate hydrolase PuuD
MVLRNTQSDARRYDSVDSPLRDEAELPLARDAIAAGIPPLGICRGMQVINVALGGSLHPNQSVLPSPADRHRGRDWDIWKEVVMARLEEGPPPEHPSHEIVIAPDSRLAGALEGGATVNSQHHQSIAALGDGVVVAATAPDGVIEAIEVPASPALCIGVQWELQENRRAPCWRCSSRLPPHGALRAPPRRRAADSAAKTTLPRPCDITAPDACTNSSKQR